MPHILSPEEIAAFDSALSAMSGNATTGSIKQLGTDFHTVYNKYPAQIPQLQREAAHAALDAAYEFIVSDSTSSMGARDRVASLIEGLSQWA